MLLNALKHIKTFYFTMLNIFVIMNTALSHSLVRNAKKINMNRKGVFIGAYVPSELKESLRIRASSDHRTLSQEITRILLEAVNGKGLAPGSVNRRGGVTVPRRRSSDPTPRLRAEDLPAATGNGNGSSNGNGTDALRDGD